MKFTVKHLFVLVTVAAIVVFVFINAFATPNEELNGETIGVLAQRTEIEVGRVTLREFASMLESEFDLHVRFSGVDSSTQISPYPSTKNVRLKNAIHFILMDVDASFRIQNGTIVFRPRDEQSDADYFGVLGPYTMHEPQMIIHPSLRGDTLEFRPSDYQQRKAKR